MFVLEEVLDTLLLTVEALGTDETAPMRKGSRYDLSYLKITRTDEWVLMKILHHISFYIKNSLAPARLHRVVLQPLKILIIQIQLHTSKSVISRIGF